jgi:hypothetical protein
MRNLGISLFQEHPHIEHTHLWLEQALKNITLKFFFALREIERRACANTQPLSYIPSYLEIFVLLSHLQEICLPMQFSSAATRGQKEAIDCVLCYSINLNVLSVRLKMVNLCPCSPLT